MEYCVVVLTHSVIFRKNKNSDSKQMLLKDSKEQKYMCNEYLVIALALSSKQCLASVYFISKILLSQRNLNLTKYQIDFDV